MANCQLARLRGLRDGWNHRCAPAPAASAVRRAQVMLDWAEANQLLVESVEAEIEGGVGVHLLDATGQRAAWIDFMNDESSMVVLSAGGRVEGLFALDASGTGPSRVLKYLG